MLLDQDKQLAIATRVTASASEAERQALLTWMTQLVLIRESKLTPVQKTKAAIAVTAKSRLVWPIAKMLAGELKRIGWDERASKSRAALVAAGLGLAVFGGQGAGIAALGTAIGLPLWVVLGAGAYFATGLIQELRSSLPKSKQPKFKEGSWEVVDVEEKKK